MRNREGWSEFSVVVEGEGKAAGTLSEIDWIVRAERVFYWGDLDSDGFGILSHLRGALRSRGTEVRSLLMDVQACRTYRHLGVNVDKDGRPLRASRAQPAHLTAEEREAYAHLATGGDVDVRRIEQEKIPLTDALRALQAGLRQERSLEA